MLGGWSSKTWGRSEDNRAPGACGGGAGGQILLVAPAVTVSGAVSALGGSGATALQNYYGSITSTPASGGYGGDGRVRVEVRSGFTGSSSPTAAVGAYVP